MFDRIQTRLQEKRRLLFTLGMLGVYCLYLFYPLNFFLGASLVNGIGMYSFAVMGAFYLYFRGLRGGWALRFLAFFALWSGISRFLLGDRALQHEGYLMYIGLLALCLAGLGVMLSGAQRRQLLRFVAPVTAIFFTALGLVGLRVFITRHDLMYPVTQAVIKSAFTGFRLEMLGYSPNIFGMWYVVSIVMLIYLMLTMKGWGWKLLWAAMLPVNYLTLCASYSRCCFVGFSVAAAALAVMLGYRRLRMRGAAKAVVLALLFLLTVPLVFKSFDAGTWLLRSWADALSAAKSAQTVTAAETDADTAAEQAGETTENDYRDTRGLTTNERSLIWRTLPEVLRREPLRLLRGCYYGDRMQIANELLAEKGVTEYKQSFHNCYLECLNFMGLPGFACLIGFSIAMVLACLRLAFSPGAPLSSQLLMLPVLATFVYSLAESLLFFNMDYRSVSFYLLAGIVLGEAAEQPPLFRRGKAEGARA